jgi:hypothetical protein
MLHLPHIISAYWLHCIFHAIALFNADQHDKANLLLKELTASCPNSDTQACNIMEVSIMHPHLVINVSTLTFSTLHIRHIYMFNSDSKPWMVCITTKLLTISLPLSIVPIYH